MMYLITDADCGFFLVADTLEKAKTWVDEKTSSLIDTYNVQDSAGEWEFIEDTSHSYWYKWDYIVQEVQEL